MNLTGFSGKLGELPSTVELPWEYFALRGTFLDCRGPLGIARESIWGLRVTVLTRSHDISSGVVGDSIDRGVWVEKGAWIGSGSLLVGCRIGAGSIVAAGTVVRCQNVAPGVIVAGNPARVIARWDGGAWNYLPNAGFERELK